MRTRPVALALLACGLAGCHSAAPVPTPDPARPADGPLHVEVVETDGQYRLHVDGEPYFVEGAGLEFGDVARLAARGGNSFRTWRTENGQQSAREVLDEAHRHGLTVTMGLEIARERPGEGRGVFGFDYDDEAAVADQLARVRAEVEALKDHPALLAWGIGNELNLESKNLRVWDAVGEIAEMIGEVDPHHPTTTMLAGISKELVDAIEARAPALDFLSVQFYADVENLQTRLRDAGYDGPYMVTEWGATGHWEVAKTPWDAATENTSSVKADLYRSRYEDALLADPDRLLGSYVFLWGQKQERTPTWYGLFMPTGEKTEPVDVMQYVWTGEWPDNRAPRIQPPTLDGRTAGAGIVLQPGASVPAAIAATDPDGDALRYRWEVREESRAQSTGGDDEAEPALISGAAQPADAARTTVTAPATPGAYRLFVTITDGEGSAAHANIPFYVEG